MANEHLMTVQELYNFAKQHGFENAKIWIPIGTNCNSSVSSARLEICSDDDNPYDKKVYLVYNS